MSRSAHAKSTYELRKLPKCSRCNTEFVLVCSGYEKVPKVVYEWECPKCHKIVPRELLREERPSEEDIRLSEIVKRLQKEQELTKKKSKRKF
jgi:hypothetical protein